MRVLADVAVIETLYAEIVENLKNIRQVHQGEIQPVILPGPVLHGEVYSKNKKRLYQQVDKEQKQDVDDKFAIHGVKVSRGLGLHDGSRF